MSKFLQLAVVLATSAGLSAAAQAQVVGMYGEYAESNGIIVNIPQNPPIVDCWNQVPPQPLDARCHKRVQKFFGATQAQVYNQPQVGNHGAQNIPTVGGAADPDNDGLDVGDPFVIPTLAFRQQLGLQVGIVLNNVVRQLDTAFTAAMPAANRATKTPAGPIGSKATAPLMRHFSQMNWTKVGNGQNNGKGANRPAPIANQNVIDVNIGAETLQMVYTLGPRQFGGTMSTLLDGRGRLVLAGPNIDGQFPPAVQPVVGTNPVGDLAVGFRTRNAAGWDWTTPGAQSAGQFRGFPGPLAANVHVACNPTPPVSPAGCNEVDNFSQGIFLANFGAATSVKHLFPLTTGTVSIVRTAIRNGGILQTETNTGMGYDTITGGGDRIVGLVAGSYTTRTDSVPTTQLNFQLLGINLRFTPEPGASAALASGLGLLGLLAHRRRI